MSRIHHVHLDPLGGIAGDMFIAAMLDAVPALEADTFVAMRAAGLPADWRLELAPHEDGALAGRRLVIEPDGAAATPTGNYPEIRQRIGNATLGDGVRTHALAILEILAEAEATVHGIALEAVHFHELADWDSIADVVGAAHLIDALAPVTWSCAPLPRGGGRIATRHGPLPVPAPATARLLEGFSLIDDGIGGERVTPTGAAILRHLGTGAQLPPGPWRAGASGLGFGTRRLPGISNVLRVMAYEQAGGARIDEQIGVIEFEVDDQSAEELAVGLDSLRAADGVLDVMQEAVFAKKGRLATAVRLLTRRERLDEVIERCFLETTTIGVRWRIEARTVLAREALAVETPDGELAVKVVRRPDGQHTAKAEMDGVRSTAGGHAGRARARRAAERCALDEVIDERHRLEGG